MADAKGFIPNVEVRTRDFKISCVGAGSIRAECGLAAYKESGLPVEETVKVCARIDHPGLGLLMDPTNYFETHNIDRMDQILNQVFDTLTDKIAIARAEDVKRSGADKSEKPADIGDEDARESRTFRTADEIELPASGLGALNHDLYLERFAEKHPDIQDIIEQFSQDDAPRAKNFLNGKFEAQGL